MKVLKFGQLFEYKTGPKIKPRWTENDDIITLYFEKFGFDRLGIKNNQIEDFANEYIGSTKVSLIMHALGIRRVLTKGDVKEEGLPHFSKSQEDKVKRYDKLKELELRKMVKDILDNTTDDEKIENLLRAEKYKKTEEKKPIKKIKELIPREGLKPIKDFYSEDEINVKEGDILNHKKYGKGIVTSITGNLFLIDFDSGTMLMTYNPNHYI